MSVEIVLPQKRSAVHIASLVRASPSLCHCSVRAVDIKSMPREVSFEEESRRTNVAFEAADVFEIVMLTVK
jgi:hypothetical protein